MVRTLLPLAVASVMLGACAHAQTTASGALAAADQANPSSMVKLDAFGYRRASGGGFVPVTLPQIPEGSDLLIRATLTADGLQGQPGSARVTLSGGAQPVLEPLPGSAAVELRVTSGTLKPGRYTAAIALIPKSGFPRPFEHPIGFEVDSAPATVPHLAKSRAALQGGIDVVDNLSDQPPRHVESVALGHDDSLLVEGWAYDLPGHSVASAVFLAVDGTRTFRAEYGISRADVASFYKDDSHNKVGFAAIIPASLFAAGSHQVDLLVVSHDGKRYFALPKPLSFLIQ